MTRLYLMRHGETVDNAAQLMQGQTQGQLNETGIRQAEEAGKELATYPFDAIISSDLKRSIDTARIVAQHHGLPVVTTPLLRERDWGDFTGRNIDEVQGLPFPDNMETLPQLMARARQFLDEVATHHKGQTVVVVSHGIMLKALQAVFYNKKMHEVEKMANAEVRCLQR